jgi:hypothetical protein
VLDHHRQAVERLTAKLSSNPDFVAALLVGSIVRGTERPDSDVDLILLATDEEYARRQASGELLYRNFEVCDYPGGYAEGKVHSVSYVEEVAERGSEPARSAFAGARILCSRMDGLEALLERVTAYPEAERLDKIRSFLAQLVIHHWYIGEAERRDDRYLLLRSTSQFALFAGRLVLAHNRILFPYHKWFMHDLRGAPDQPAELIPALERLLAQPGRENANTLLGCILTFREWEGDLSRAAEQFATDTEQSWLRGQAPLEDL